MPIDVGTAHNHTAAVGKPSVSIALISYIPNPAPPPAILMSDVRNASGRCANCRHLHRNRTGISCRMPCSSHAPNICLSSLKKTAICTCICWWLSKICGSEWIFIQFIANRRFYRFSAECLLSLIEKTLLFAFYIGGTISFGENQEWLFWWAFAYQENNRVKQKTKSPCQPIFLHPSERFRSLKVNGLTGVYRCVFRFQTSQNEKSSAAIATKDVSFQSI